MQATARIRVLLKGLGATLQHMDATYNTTRHLPPARVDAARQDARRLLETAIREQNRHQSDPRTYRQFLRLGRDAAYILGAMDRLGPRIAPRVSYLEESLARVESWKTQLDNLDARVQAPPEAPSLWNL